MTENHTQPTYGSKVTRFLKHQAEQVRAGGWPIFTRKVFALLKLLLLLPFALPLVLIIRMISPFFVIRFGLLASERIGHFAGNTEVYLCERDAGINTPWRPYVDIWYRAPFVCNIQLKKMWDRTLKHVVPFDISPLDRLIRWVPGGNVHGILMPNQDRDVYGFMDNTPPHLCFTVDEERRGKDGLMAMGVPGGAPFVCLYARDSAYLATTDPNKDWQYHDYRDSNIHNHVWAAEELTKRGYYVIRIGAVVAENLNISNPKIIDYASNGQRTDFMDIYLGAKCCFFLGTPGGFFGVPVIFRRPCAMVNLVPLEYIISWISNGLTIPKKYWLCSDRRFMTFREIFDSGAGRFLHTQKFKDMNIEIIENTPEEIAALAIEMDEKLRGIWRTNDEDEELQQQFWRIFPKSELHGEFRAKIGSEFLRQNKDLLY